eukprot:jgi/Orpsp1_1/1187115/evm.model.d7180000055527.1
MGIYTRDNFIEENRDGASIYRWLTSKGTNYTCYEIYLESIRNDREKGINENIEFIRTI